jgi:predicted metal-dependent hydrolase
MTKQATRHPAIRLLRRRTPDAPPARERFVVRVGSDDHEVHVKRTSRARRFTLRVKPGAAAVTLTVPAWARLSEARAFAERHVDWMAQRFASATKRTPFAPGAIVPFRGVPHRIVHRPGTRGVVWRETGADGVAELHVAGEADFLERRLVDFFKAEARRDLVAATAKYCARLGKFAARVSVRDQTTRWGSCSANGFLSYSWRLVLAPPFVLEYLAAHEVAHLKEMNHAPRFWRTLRDLYPEVDVAKTWMKEHGASLHAVGPAAGARPSPTDM